MEKESQKQMKRLEDEALLFHEQTITDALFYSEMKKAEANKLLLSPQYLQLELIRSVANTTKVYFGPSMQSLFLDFMDMLSNNQLSKGHALQTPKAEA